ncbi:sugar transferase [Candidatus Poribacteria bacterium]|nr:sugar transferase [Candidatus Poribacteria bacterium]
MLKRIFDISISLVALALLAPFFFVCAVIIKLTSRGPIFYRGRRVGKDGKIFLMHKFRSMVVDADKMGTDLTPQGDPRVTKFGKFLRKTKIDELPQIIDVIKGDMSLVGPRPESPMYAQHYDERQKRVLDVCPGIVGPTQIICRHEDLILKDKEDPDKYYIRELMPKKVEIDLNYIDNRSFWLDIQILLKSFFVVVMVKSNRDSIHKLLDEKSIS